LCKLARLIAVNLNGVFHNPRHGIRHLPHNAGGTILTIGSEGSHQSHPRPHDPTAHPKPMSSPSSGERNKSGQAEDTTDDSRMDESQPSAVHG
jgi:hypothetical protein